MKREEELTVSDDNLAYNIGLEIRYAIAASGVDPIQHIPEVDVIIKRRIAEIRSSAEATEGGAHEKALMAAYEEFNRIACERITETRSLAEVVERCHFFANRGAVSIRAALTAKEGE